MRAIDVATLFALALIAACEPADFKASKMVESTACAESALVGTRDSEVTTVKATASCVLVLDDHDGGCRLTGTYSDMSPGEVEGSAWFTIQEASEGCGFEAPHSFELIYVIDGDAIEFSIGS